IAEIERTASGEFRAPQGELMVSAPAVMGRRHVLPIVTEFLRAFPEVQMRLQLTDRYVCAPAPPTLSGEACRRSPLTLWRTTVLSMRAMRLHTIGSSLPKGPRRGFRSRVASR